MLRGEGGAERSERVGDGLMRFSFLSHMLKTAWLIYEQPAVKSADPPENGRVRVRRQGKVQNGAKYNQIWFRQLR